MEKIQRFLPYPETSKWNTNIKLELTQVEKFIFTRTNGLVDNYTNIINEEHFASLRILF
jgi:hypothetical protein